MADIYRVPHSASFVPPLALPSKSRSFVSSKPTPFMVWQQSLSLLPSRPLSAYCDVSRDSPPRAGLQSCGSGLVGRVGGWRKYSEPQGLRRQHGGAGEGAGIARSRAGSEWGPEAAPAPRIRVRCSSGWTRSSQTQRHGFLAEPEGGVLNVSRGRAGLSSNPMGLTRVPALPFLFRFSELDP